MGFQEDSSALHSHSRLQVGDKAAPHGARLDWLGGHTRSLKKAHSEQTLNTFYRQFVQGTIRYMQKDRRDLLNTFIGIYISKRMRERREIKG